MRSTRTRTRSGWRPTCRSCETRGYICQWGLKASFHPSRSLRLSTPDRATLLAIERGRQTTTDETRGNHLSSPLEPSTSIIIDDTEEVVKCYQDCHDASSSTDSEPVLDEEPTLNAIDTTLCPSGNVHFPLGLISHDTIQPDTTLDRTPDNEAANESFLPSPQTGTVSGIHEVGGLSYNDQVSAVQFAVSPASYVLPFSLGQAVSRNASPLPEPSKPVTDVECARLVSLYLSETGTWCETTDSERHFTSKSIYQMLDSKPFLASAIALASRQHDAVQDQRRSVTLELYQYTIQLLLRQDPDKAGAPVLATCTLLCVYEMMASCVWEWRRHLKGCASLLHNRKWNGSCSGIVKSSFWAFARIDVWAAYISGKTTLIPTDSWVDDSSIPSVAAKGNVDDYCNLAILTFAQIVNLLADARLYEKDGSPVYYSAVGKLWDALQEWRRLRPKEVCPLLRESSRGSNPFPTVVLSWSSANCGNTFYHAGCILLLQTGCLGARANALGVERDPIWHARELGGISASNISHSNWVNQLQPLYIAGTVFADRMGICFRDAPRQTQWAGAPWRVPVTQHVPLMEMDDIDEYNSEKIALLRQLARIERETGWKTSDRALDLRRLWGFG
ncbi:hypothetical protein PMG11_01937 [Penicillium brasilianum]|uniref:Zn(II)2Cys6 transcription factor n=1 Tax=Penicillium brasilianum TaxID=104259 RepID=A0A0F7TJQ0_PENBI|nr:hypothetical protein PMG11_01937 [Penicillium brasilianum]